MNTNSLAPGFLIASPELRGPWFTGSVILLLSHDDEAAFGLIINRKNEQLDGDALLDLLGIDGALLPPTVLMGGPVSPERAFVLHGEGFFGEETTEVLPGLLLSTQQETLASLCQRAEHPLLVALGYAGWGAGQLEQEIEEGSWLHLDKEDAARRVLETPASELWERLADTIGAAALGSLRTARGLQ